jgi:AbrB family looped-hinge helix DNA binding protein
MPFFMRNGIMNGMKVTIDRVGRIIVPKPLRDRLRLLEGSTLEIEENASSFLLRPVTQNPVIVPRDGLLVYVGEVPRSVRQDKLVEDVREERLDEIARQ